MTKFDDIDFKDALRKIVLSEDQRSAVIGSHLCVEAFLNELLNMASVRGDWSNKTMRGIKFDYIHKLTIAISFGLLDEEVEGPLKKLGKHRNDFAHDISYSISDDEQKDFLKSIPAEYRTKAEEYLAETLHYVRPEEENVIRLHGFEGRRALSSSFLAGLVALLTHLAQEIDDYPDQTTDPGCGRT